MTLRKRLNSTNGTKNDKKPKTKTKDGLLSIKRRAAHQTPEQFAAEMHPPKKLITNKISDDAVIKERVIKINAKNLEGIAASIETGKMLIGLQDEIEHGKWGPLFKGCDRGYFAVEPAEVQLGGPPEFVERHVTKVTQWRKAHPRKIRRHRWWDDLPTSAAGHFIKPKPKHTRR